MAHDYTASNAPFACAYIVLWMLDRLRAEGIQLFYNYLPGLIADLSGQYSNYTDVSPCFDSLLYQIQHINETVIGLPPNMEVCDQFILFVLVLNTCEYHLLDG